MTTDRDTKDWIRTPADELAAKAGMRFDAERGQFACDWIESRCRLYEGDKAGELLELLPYQRDFFMRLFSWVRWSNKWDAWIRRFTHAGLWAAKKNGKSPGAAAFNLYMVSGDGEQGQKVYMMANGGQQARIAQRHTVKMIQQMPAAERADFKVNNTTLNIDHLPTNSLIEIVTGDDRRGADAKHGYNGSVTIDEMHVVNRVMMEAVGRAGLSRREPLQVSFSTAGTDPSSVGFERFQYGRQVNSGERADPHYLHVEYCAPDDAGDADIDENIDEYGRMANPAWGSLIDPEEFRSDWQRSKQTPRKVAIFKQERLNLWVGSTNQWLDSAAWARAARAFTLADCAGRDCYAGLDLSRSGDMTANVFTFPWPEDGPECVRVWPMFWLPRDTARDREHLFPFATWAAGRHLTLTPGAKIDYWQVEQEIREAIEAHNLNVLALYYDEHYANEMTQSLHEGRTVGAESLPGVVAERVVFKQSLMPFTGPAKEFERRVKVGEVVHPDNPVMNWQVGHCEVWSDRNQNIRPVKPAPHSGKSVDGVVSAVMTFAGLMAPVADSTIPPLVVIDL
jgi:phage terminase large subunit-like protein